MQTNTLILRITVAVILLTHGVPSILTGDVNSFGEMFLNQIGFAPIGVPLAWIVKLSHIVCAFLLIFNKFLKPACFLTIGILLMGIITVHFKEGWYVVGGGRNGVEYNVLLIAVLAYLSFPNGFKVSKD